MRRGTAMPRPWAPRWVKDALLGSSLVLGLGSCTGVLSLDSFQGATQALCDILVNCADKWKPNTCETTLGDRLYAPKVAASDRAAWLTKLDDSACLGSCSTARFCLDDSPGCLASGNVCTITEDCCQFSTGESTCDGRRCCRPDGVACTADRDCCHSSCNTTGTTKYCGDFLCKQGGTKCHIDAECCSQTCLQTGVCSRTICQPLKFPCQTDNECCDGNVCDAGTHTCVVRICPADGTQCQSDTDCCPSGCCGDSGVGLLCWQGVCSKAECFSNGVDCLIDGDCCSTFCDPILFHCNEPRCVAGAGACTTGSECCSGACTGGRCTGRCSVDYCTKDADCCSGQCVAGSTCTPFVPSKDCAHSPCTEGDPKLLTCDINSASTQCAGSVCAVDPFCCTTRWDSGCVAEALTLCGSDCATP